MGTNARKTDEIKKSDSNKMPADNQRVKPDQKKADQVCNAEVSGKKQTKEQVKQDDICSDQSKESSSPSVKH
jgi:hypothetical protein